MFHGSELTTKELQQVLKKKNLPIYYKKKTDLIRRLLEGQINSDSEEEIKEDTISKAEEKEEKKTIKTTSETMANIFAFQDVENSLSLFDGESVSVEKWTKQFEEMATVFVWSDLQKFLYAKRLLKGAATSAVDTCGQGVNGFATLKDFLKNEFKSFKQRFTFKTNIYQKKKR